VFPSLRKHLFHFFLLLETHKKFVKIEFSSVAEKKEHVLEKYLFLIISEDIHFDDDKSFFFNWILSLVQQARTGLYW
jgi:hypothetical protein